MIINFLSQNFFNYKIDENILEKHSLLTKNEICEFQKILESQWYNKNFDNKNKKLNYLNKKIILNNFETSILECFFILLKFLYMDNKLLIPGELINNGEGYIINNNIILRGAKDLEDFLFMGMNINIKSHFGLLKHFENKKEIFMKKIIENINKDKNINLIGHSMGGSFCQLISIELLKLGYNKMKIFLYHTPPCFGEEYYEKMRENNIEIFRIFNNNDITNYIFPQFKFPDYIYNIDVTERIEIKNYETIYSRTIFSHHSYPTINKKILLI